MKTNEKFMKTNGKAWESMEKHEKSRKSMEINENHANQ